MDSQATANQTNAEDETSQTETTAASREPSLFGMVVRDLAVVFGALSLWAAADAWYQVTGLWIAQVIAVGDAILVGLIISSLFHEWGHYAGAKASNATAPRVAAKGLSLFRFNFDYAGNDHKQFHWMTYGGHIFHWGILLILFFSIPLDNLGRIALVSAQFGFIVFATFIEYNIIKDTWDGKDPAVRITEITPKDFQQSYVAGTLAGAFAIAALA
ncbi:MAG: hypothetical protein AAF513_05440 [Pseudomonadota bacterium]